MRHLKLLLAVVGATVLLAALTALASAGRLSTTNNTGIRAVWERMDFGGGFNTVECGIILEGSLHSRVIEKVVGRLIGYITFAAVRVASCRNGEVTVLSETLPWHITYGSFSGTLPNISAIATNSIGASFRVREVFGITCLARSTAAEPASLTFNREVATRRITSATIGGTIRCGTVNGTLGGTTSSINEGLGTIITVTLI